MVHCSPSRVTSSTAISSSQTISSTAARATQTPMLSADMMCRPGQAFCTPFLSPAASEYSGSLTEHITHGRLSGELWVLASDGLQDVTIAWTATNSGLKKSHRETLVYTCTERPLCICAQGCPWHITEVWSELLVRVGTCSLELASLCLQSWKPTGDGIWGTMRL